MRTATLREILGSTGGGSGKILDVYENMDWRGDIENYGLGIGKNLEVYENSDWMGNIVTGGGGGNG